MTTQCEWIGCYTDLDEPGTYYCHRHATAEDDIYDRWKDQQIMDEYER